MTKAEMIKAILAHKPCYGAQQIRKSAGARVTRFIAQACKALP